MDALASGAGDLALELIRQTAAMHPTAQHLHIGCDEVFNLGQCVRCVRRGRRRLCSRSRGWRLWCGADNLSISRMRLPRKELESKVKLGNSTKQKR